SSTAATHTSWPGTIVERTQCRVSSSVWSFGRNVSPPNDAMYSSAIVSMSSSPASLTSTAPNLRPVPRERDEPVRLTKIYTRGGDAGQTSLGDGSRGAKTHSRIAAYGTVDELNSALGVVLAGACPVEIADVLARVQNELFDLGADLSVPVEHSGRLRVTQEQVDQLERDCDRFNEDLPELRSFVLPGGAGAAGGLEGGRTGAGGAEGEALTAASEHDVSPLVLVYLNRLSDLLFILSRAANAADGHEEPLWKPGSSS